MVNRKFIPIVIAILVIICATIYFEYYRHSDEDNGVIKGTGTIEVTEIEIASRIAGRIKEMPAGEGKTVEKDALLIRLESEELNAKKAAAKANLENASKNLKRMRELYESGSVSRKDYDGMSTAYRVAKSKYEYVKATLKETVIHAPFKGTVLGKNLEAGELAFPGSSIITMADLRRVWIKIYIRETKIGLVKPGQEALVRVDSYPGEEFRGEVVRIADKAEFTPKTIQTKEERVKLVFAVKIQLENPEMKLKPGMPADAEIILEDQYALGSGTE